MNEHDQNTDEQRRKLVKMAAATAVVLPVSGLVACGGGDDAEKSAATKAEEAASAAADTVKETADAAADMADDAKEAAGEMADKAEGAMEEAADKAGDMAAEAEEKAGDMVAEAEEKAGEMVAEAKDAAADMVAGMPKLDENNPQANALGYVHDASKVDQSRFAGRGAEANEYCKNCSLYVAREDGWGACAIFAGKAVNENGWCNSWNPAG